jgi:hypothetical protein
MRIIKTIIFHILLSLRGLVLTISKLLAFASFGAFAIIIFTNELSAIPLAAKIAIAAYSILFTSIYWFYDYLILYLQPEMLDIKLLK